MLFKPQENENKMVHVFTGHLSYFDAHLKFILAYCTMCRISKKKVPGNFNCGHCSYGSFGGGRCTIPVGVIFI